jgi:hypothetical protein
MNMANSIRANATAGTYMKIAVTIAEIATIIQMTAIARRKDFRSFMTRLSMVLTAGLELASTYLRGRSFSFKLRQHCWWAM